MVTLVTYSICEVSQERDKIDVENKQPTIFRIISEWMIIGHNISLLATTIHYIGMFVKVEVTNIY